MRYYLAMPFVFACLVVMLPVKAGVWLTRVIDPESGEMLGGCIAHAFKSDIR